jgi:hypothetical protein
VDDRQTLTDDELETRGAGFTETLGDDTDTTDTDTTDTDDADQSDADDADQDDAG